MTKTRKSRKSASVAETEEPKVEVSQNPVVLVESEVQSFGTMNFFTQPPINRAAQLIILKGDVIGMSFPVISRIANLLRLPADHLDYVDKSEIKAHLHEIVMAPLQDFYHGLMAAVAYCMNEKTTDAIFDDDWKQAYSYMRGDDGLYHRIYLLHPSPNPNEIVGSEIGAHIHYHAKFNKLFLPEVRWPQ